MQGVCPTYLRTFPLQDIFFLNPIVSVTLLFSFLFSRRGKNILWKKRNYWKRFKPPRLLSFHFCFCEGYNERSRENLAVISVQTNEFRRVAQSRLQVEFGGLVLPPRAPEQGCSDSTIPHISPEMLVMPIQNSPYGREWPLSIAC